MVSHQELFELAEKAVSESLKHAEKQVGYELPESTVHGLFVENFLGETYQLDEIVSLLTNNDSFPRVVDIAVRGLSDQGTFMLWLPTGHPESSYIDVDSNHGLGPFKPVGIMSPLANCRPNPDQLKEQYSNWIDRKRSQAP